MSTTWTTEPITAAPTSETEIGAADASPVGAALTVEVVIWLLVALVALCARLLALGAQPLTPDEAAQAWPAWLAASATTVPGVPAPESALLHSAQAMLFWLIGDAAETTARLPVALVSTVIPLLAWFWRDRLGRGAALVLALLLALNPWLIVLGRSALSGALSAALALAALTAIHCRAAAHGESRTAQSVAAAAIGLLVVSGPQAWNWLIVLAFYMILVARPVGASLLSLRSLLIAAAAALIGSTRWLAQPQDISLVSASATAWLGQFSSGEYGIAYPWLRLVVDQPFVALFGVAGLVGLWSRPLEEDARSHRRFLSLWLALGIVAALLPGRTPQALLLLVVPLASCAALAVAWYIVRARTMGGWGEAGLLGLLAAVIFVALFLRGTRNVWEPGTTSLSIWISLAMFALLALLFVGYAYWAGGKQATLVALAILGGALFLMTISATVQLASGQQVRERDGFFAAVASPSSRALEADVSALSDRRTGDARQLPVVVVTGPGGAPDAQIGWLLRRMRDLRFVLEPPDNPVIEGRPAPLIVTQSPAGNVGWNAAYLGVDYPVRQRWQATNLPSIAGEAGDRWATGVRPWLRWLLYREAGPPATESVELWATQ